MIPVNACLFVTDLIRRVSALNGIGYSSAITYRYPPLVENCITRNIIYFRDVEEVAFAINKIAWFDGPINDEEFNLLLPEVGRKLDNFTNFFENSVNLCYFPDNSPFSAFKFLRYLAYVSSFAIFCHEHHSFRALDFACFTIMRVIAWERRIFRDLNAWQRLVNAAETINSYDLSNPGLNWISA